MDGAHAHGFFGRDVELAVIDEFVEGLERGPSALVLAGEAGIGKTSLSRSAVDAARDREAWALTCRGVEADASLSFSGLSELLAPVLDDVLPLLVGPRRRALEVALLLVEPGEVAPPGRACQRRVGRRPSCTRTGRTGGRSAPGGVGDRQDRTRRAYAAQVTPGVLERGVELEERLGLDVEHWASPRFEFCRLLVARGEIERPRVMLAALTESAEARGDEGTKMMCLWRLGQVEWLAGRWVSALEHVTSAHELTDQTQHAHSRAWVGRIKGVRRGRSRPR